MLRRPVLWLLGLIALFSAIVEGASGDWSALFSVRERGMSEAAGAVTFSVFCVAMGIVRLVGEQIERRFGAVRILVAGSLLAGLGLLLDRDRAGRLARPTSGSRWPAAVSRSRSRSRSTSPARSAGAATAPAASVRSASSRRSPTRASSSARR